MDSRKPLEVKYHDDFRLTVIVDWSHVLDKSQGIACDLQWVVR